MMLTKISPLNDHINGEAESDESNREIVNTARSKRGILAITP